jgi:hypothetical protein
MVTFDNMKIKKNVMVKTPQAKKNNHNETQGK